MTRFEAASKAFNDTAGTGFGLPSLTFERAMQAALDAADAWERASPCTRVCVDPGNAYFRLGANKMIDKSYDEFPKYQPPRLPYFTVVLIDVEISDQMGTSERHLVGVFNDDAIMSSAKAWAEDKYRTRRTVFREIKTTMNNPQIRPR